MRESGIILMPCHVGALGLGETTFMCAIAILSGLSFLKTPYTPGKLTMLNFSAEVYLQKDTT